MADTPTPAPVENAAPAPAAEPTVAEQLEALFAEDTPATPAEPETTPEAAAAPAETPAPADATPTIEQQLEAIEEAPAPPAPPTPALTSEQQQILSAIPTPDVARQVLAEAQYLKQLDAAFTANNFDQVESLLPQEAIDGLKEHIYQKHVRSGEWLDRYIKETEGSPVLNNSLKSIEREVQALKAQLAAKDQQQTQAQMERQRQQLIQGYTNHVNGLFDKLNFSANDRPWVLTNLDARIRADSNLQHQISSGQFGAVNKLFKEVVREYVTRDQQLTQSREATRQAQQQHKPLVSAAAAPQTGALPDDINQVPKGQEKTWMNEQLTKLFRS